MNGMIMIKIPCRSNRDNEDRERQRIKVSKKTIINKWQQTDGDTIFISKSLQIKSLIQIEIEKFDRLLLSTIISNIATILITTTTLTTTTNTALATTTASIIKRSSMIDIITTTSPFTSKSTYCTSSSGTIDNTDGYSLCS